jgi:PAS domain S-box-containing protein
MPHDLPSLASNELPEPKTSVLLVDDRHANLLALRAMLEDLGHDLVQARSGEDALRLLLNRDFAVVLLDVKMDGLDGFETARLIRSRPRSRHTPIIFLTGQGDPLDVETAYGLGAVDYLVKPLLPVVVRAKVVGFVELYRKTEQVKRQAEQLRQVEQREFERKLAKENARFRALTEHSSDAVTLIGSDGTVLYSSPSSRRILGYEADEFLGRNGFEAVHPDDLTRVADHLGELVGTPRAMVTVELRVRHKDGSWRWLECVATNLLAEPAVAAVVVNFRDITERHQATEALRESEQRFVRFMQHLPGLAWIKDAQGRYVYANDAAEKVFGKVRQTLHGKTDDELFTADIAAQFRENDLLALASGTGVRVIETLEHEDRTLHHSIVSKFPIPGPGEAISVGGIAIDITDRMQMEEALRNADRRKDEFLATLAHELRNPLAPIRNGLALLRRAGDNQQMVEQVQGMMERQLALMVRLVDDLLDVSRITQGKLHLRLERVELAQVVQSAIEASRPLIDASDQELTIRLPPEPVYLDADATRLAQVFGNLLNNAAKYTDRGGHIRLAAESRSSEVVVSVKDTGIGIEAEHLPRLFEMFSQVDPALERAHGGLGIGLTLAKSLVEMHRGCIEARSEGPGRGSEFIVHLPAMSSGAVATVEDDDTIPLRRQSAPFRRVLVVDDNVDAAETLAMLLRDSGYDIRTAHEGVTALKTAQAFRPEAVLLDLGLPGGMSGYDLAPRLRGEPGLEKVMLVALTGFGQEEDRRRTREAGFNAHLVKPVDLDSLLAVLAGG